MTILKSAAQCALATAVSLSLAGCAYGTVSDGGYGPYAANAAYDYPYDDGIYGPDFFAGGFDHFHRGFGDHRAIGFGHGFHPGGFGHFHGGGMQVAHTGGFGGHGRG